MKKIFGIVMLVLLFVGISNATPKADLGTANLEYTISESFTVDVLALTVETPSVATFVDVKSTIKYEVASFKQLKTSKVTPLLLSNTSVTPPPLLANSKNTITLFKANLELFNTPKANYTKGKEVLTVSLDFSKVGFINTMTKQSLFKVLRL